MINENKNEIEDIFEDVVHIFEDIVEVVETVIEKIEEVFDWFQYYIFFFIGFIDTYTTCLPAS